MAYPRLDKVDGRLVRARPGPVFPDVDFNRQPALSMRGWETCRLSSRLQRVG